MILLFLQLGCENPTVNPPELEISSLEIDFGAVPARTEATESFILENTGSGVITVLSVQLIDGESRVWNIDRDEDAELERGEQLTVDVTFLPDAEEEYLGRIQVRSTDEENPSLLVDVFGFGGESTADLDGDGYSPSTGDCDDDDATSYPDAEELCDGRDNNCNGELPERETDADGDGWRVCDDDCDDDDNRVYPGATEICDDKDTDCDGSEGDRLDTDGDGYSLCQNDCDDTEPLAGPGFDEVCDGIDNDCSGEADDIDEDGDGHSICHPAGDCDDDDPLAFPVVVDPDFGGQNEKGTDKQPYRSVQTAYANLNDICPEIFLVAGTYELSMEFRDVEVGFRGEGEDYTTIHPAETKRAFEVYDEGVLHLSDLTVSGGSVSGDGGVLYIEDATLNAKTMTFYNNTATGDGGAVAASSGSLFFEGVTFLENTGGDDGGAVAVLSGSLTDNGSHYYGNRGVRGGAVLSESSTLSLDGVRFEENTATDAGGAVVVTGGAGVNVQRCEFWGNTASSGGGGISLTDVYTPTGSINNNVFQDNDGGDQGGAVEVTGNIAAMQVYNNSVVANVASGEGAGLYCDAGNADVSFTSNLVTFNDGESGVYTTGNATASYNMAYATSSNTDFELGIDDGNNTVLDPLFVDFSNDRDPTNDDLDLAVGSPAKNSGPPDADWNDPDGSRNDRGHGGGPGAD
jgi:predicted outer membrane repeat protein